MPSNPLDKLLKPRFPSCAVGIETGTASVVQLDRARGGFVVKRAAAVNLPPDLVRSSFDESNLADAGELARALSDLITSAALLRQRKWSVTLPEAATRAAILTVEGSATSRREIEEVLEWKIERAFGATLAELRVTREQLVPDPQKQSRYLVTAVRHSVLAEYESVFAGLGWQAGLVLPRHAGEEQWLRNGHQGDGLLLTAHDEGFTAVLMRGNRPLTLRTVFCEADECDDELHRVLLFYRERSGTNGQGEVAPVDRLLVVGDSLDKQKVASIAQETLGVSLKPLNAADVGLLIPAGELAFDTIAAPAGLARLAW
jgi:Tfp pilus assembly PilM family ATPase